MILKLKKKKPKGRTFEDCKGCEYLRAVFHPECLCYQAHAELDHRMGQDVINTVFSLSLIEICPLPYYHKLEKKAESILWAVDNNKKVIKAKLKLKLKP